MSCSIATCWPSIRPHRCGERSATPGPDSLSFAMARWTPPSFDPPTSKVFSKGCSGSPDPTANSTAPTPSTSSFAGSAKCCAGLAESGHLKHRPQPLLAIAPPTPTRSGADFARRPAAAVPGSRTQKSRSGLEMRCSWRCSSRQIWG
jgi:hypothetical protein